MRILLLNQFFWPDSAATSQLLTDLAQDLSEQGHKVDVICGGSYAATSDSDNPSVSHVPSLSIHRISSVRFSRGALGRIASYLSFYIGATWRAFTVTKPDVVLTLTTPPLLSLIGALLHVLRGPHFYIWEMDMYPDVAVDLGYIQAGSLLHKITGALSDWARKHANGIIALGECMRARLVAHGVDCGKIHTIHNWADSRQISVIPQRPRDGTMQIVYSGNLGLAHDIDTIANAMRRLNDDDRFRFTFIGAGRRRDELASLLEKYDIRSATMRAYVPRADLSVTLAQGDIGLVTQRDDCCGTVVPSKVYGLMAAGRPILFIGPAAATPAEIVLKHDCGWRVACGDTNALVRLLLHLAENPQEITRAGLNARQALETHYDRSHGSSRIIALITGETALPSLGASPEQLAGETVTAALR